MILQLFDKLEVPDMDAIQCDYTEALKNHPIGMSRLIQLIDYARCLQDEIAYRNWFDDLTNRFSNQDPFAHMNPASMTERERAEDKFMRELAVRMLNYRPEYADDIKDSLREFYEKHGRKDEE